MKSHLLIPAATIAIMAAMAHPVFAHEHHIFRINGLYYQFTVGSLNEPVAVDDKTGVDLRVELVSAEHAMEKHNDAPGGAEEKFPPVTGLEKTLKVELSAGGMKKVLELKPAYNMPGAYKAVFIPTVQTTYSYRLFGAINDTPVDLMFTCGTAEAAESKDDMAMTKISDKVDRLSKAGAFGCPAAKEDLGFPKSAPALIGLDEKATDAADQAASAGQSAQMLGMAGIIIGLLGLFGGAMAFMKTRKQGM